MEHEVAAKLIQNQKRRNISLSVGLVLDVWQPLTFPILYMIIVTIKMHDLIPLSVLLICIQDHMGMQIPILRSFFFLADFLMDYERSWHAFETDV